MGKDMEELLPHSSLTAELLRLNTEFEKINSIIAQTDTYIQAVLLSKKEAKFSLSAQMVSGNKRLIFI